MRRKIVLFSAFSPDLGGGGTNLRTLLPDLRKTMDVEWLYTDDREAKEPGTVRLDRSLSGGPIWRDLSRMVVLWSGVPVPRFRRVVAQLRARAADAYWVVGNSEGVLVARALSRAGARVHLSIQDDIPWGVLGRSRRYRALAPLISPIYDAALRRMASIDVTSDGMQRYYADRLGVRSVVVHPYISELPPFVPPSDGQRHIRIGHIGSLYKTDSWVLLLQALRAVAAKRGVKATMVMIGLAPKFRAAAAGFEDVVEFVDQLPEEAAIGRLQSCHAVYAMYPFDPASDVFRRTSLPTKLSTYLRTQRPILAHSPAGSTLLDIVGQFEIGAACTTNEQVSLAAALEQVLSLRVDHLAFERARAGVYGIDNVERQRACLEATA